MEVLKTAGSLGDTLETREISLAERVSGAVVGAILGLGIGIKWAKKLEKHKALNRYKCNKCGKKL